MTDVVAVKRYSQALFDTSEKFKETTDVKEDLLALTREYERSGLKEFLLNPKYAPAVKSRVLDQVGKTMSSKVMLPFLMLLLKKSRTNLLPFISKEFVELEREAKGIVPCEVVLAKKPSEGFLSKIEKALVKITGKKIEMKFRVNEDILGGVAIRIKNNFLDASFKTRLNELKMNLLEAKIT